LESMNPTVSAKLQRRKPPIGCNDVQLSAF
jgi:hypothetical protein